MCLILDSYSRRTNSGHRHRSDLGQIIPCFGILLDAVSLTFETLFAYQHHSASDFQCKYHGGFIDVFLIAKADLKF